MEFYFIILKHYKIDIWYDLDFVGLNNWIFRLKNAFVSQPVDYSGNRNEK